MESTDFQNIGYWNDCHFWGFSFCFWLIVGCCFSQKISRLIFAPEELYPRVSMSWKYGDFPISARQIWFLPGFCPLRSRSCETGLVWSGDFRHGEHELHTYILMCQLLESLSRYHKQGFDNILKPSFIIIEYFLFSCLQNEPS